MGAYNAMEATDNENAKNNKKNKTVLLILIVGNEAISTDLFSVKSSHLWHQSKVSDQSDSIKNGTYKPLHMSHLIYRQKIQELQQIPLNFDAWYHKELNSWCHR